MALILQQPATKQAAFLKNRRETSATTSSERTAEPSRHIANYCSSIKIRVERREERFALRDGLRRISSLPRVRACGKKRMASMVALRSDEDRRHVGFGNLETCGSVWACPVCAAKISAVRKQELEKLCQTALDQGCYVSMLTLTERNLRKLGDQHLLDSLVYAWHRVMSGRKSQDFRRQLGLVGYVRALEITYGKHGAHAHIHVLVVSRKDPRTTIVRSQRKQGRRRAPYPVEEYTPFQFVTRRWAKALKDRGVEFLPEVGADWDVAHGNVLKLARYVGKLGFVSTTPADSISKEVALGGFKTARNGNRTPFQVLADAITTGSRRDIALWRSYERLTKGRRALTWSHGLRAWAGLGREKTDEEIAAQDKGDRAVCLIPAKDWDRKLQPCAGHVLTIFQTKGVDAVFHWFRLHRIRYLAPDDPRLCDKSFIETYF